jgi:hypothetical protein
MESSRRSTDVREKSRSSTDHRRSTDRREKPRSSVDRRDKSRKSVDHPDKPRPSVDQPDKPRKSIDRSVYSYIRSVCFTVDFCYAAYPLLCLVYSHNPLCDSFGGMMRSVKLCNIDCFKVTSTSGSWK